MAAKSLKFIQINIYKGRYLNSLLDFLRSYDPDIVAMQEVTAGEMNLCDKLPRPESPRYSSSSLHERAVFRSMYSLSRIHSKAKSPQYSASEYKNLDLFEYFKKELGLSGVIDKVMEPVDSRESFLGNAVFSKYEITGSEVLVLNTFEGLTLAKFDMMENFPLFSRHLLSAECVVDGRKIHVISWHAAWTAPPEDTDETLRQASEVADYLKNLKEPFILGCDMNAVPQSRVAGLINNVARNLMMESGVLQTTNPKIHKIAPRGFLIDYIFTSTHFRLKKLEVPEVTISDHLPVVAELEFNPEA